MALPPTYYDFVCKLCRSAIPHKLIAASRPGRALRRRPDTSIGARYEIGG